MATNEKRRDKSGELQDVTTWFKVTLWRQQAENAAKYLTKGSPVYIEGRLRIEEWTDRDNNRRYTLDVQATDMQFISAGARDGGGGDYSTGGHDEPDMAYTGGSAAAGASAGKAAASTASESAPPAGDDDIPF